MSLTFVQLQNKVLGWLDETSDSTVVLANVKEAISAANALRAGEREWPFMLASQTVSVVAGTTEYTLTAFNTIHSVYSVGADKTLTQVPLRHAPPNYTHDNAFVMEGTTLRLLYTPTATDSLTVKYYRQPTELSADADVPDIPYPHSRVLIYDALLDLGLYSEDINASKVGLWQERLARLEAGLYAAYLDANSINGSQHYPLSPDDRDVDGD